jgi:uncharacterized protein involved in type VI secretion and phage assembly
MGLFDIIDDIAEKQVMKTETGDNRVFGVMTGIVAKNYDKDMPGRICVSIPVRDDGGNELKWARMVMPSSGKEWGHYFMPEVGDMVLLVFDQGNIEKPFVIGCIPNDNNKFLTRAVDERNRYKKIITKNGNSIIFEDNPEGDGEQDKIEIITAKEKHKIILDNEKNIISISDKNGDNKILMKTEAGQMEIKADKKLVINVGTNINVTLNGSNGAVTVECDKFNVKAGNGIVMESNAQAKLTGANISIEATSVLKANSNGTAVVKGMPLKLG